MNRRSFLGSVGATASLGVAGTTLTLLSDRLSVRVWFSDAAAEYEGLEERIEGYLGAALEPAVGEVAISFAESSVSLPSEDDRDVLADQWPKTVLGGVVGLADVDPVSGVNLLVTDGDPTRQPSGFARPRVAATTGARYVASMPPAEETPAAVPYSLEAASTQLLLHECGHALGIGHDHGSVVVRDGAVVASPMVSSYYWAGPPVRKKHLNPERNACGTSYPTGGPVGERRLRLRYADCAATAISQ